jgi:hypothetical protein
MRNIRDAESSILFGQAKAKTALAKFVVSWFEPYTDMALVLWWRNLTPMERVELKMKDPEAYEKVKKMISDLEVKDAAI